MHSISSRELSEWMAYERITGPQGVERGDVQAAIVASTVANVMGSGKGKRLGVEEFIPKWEKPADSGDQIETQVAMLRRATAPKKRPAPKPQT